MIPLAGATTLVLWLSSSSNLSSSSSSSCSFLPAPSDSTIRRGRHGRLLMTSSVASNDEDSMRDKSRRGKLIAAARRTTANIRRVPRHQEEAAGISTSLGLWRRSAATAAIRQYAKEIYNTIRNERRGKRRRKLKTRFKNYLSLDDGRSNDNDNVNDINGYNIRPEEGNENEDDSDVDNTNLHAMRARAGVLRTRIRLRQESLMHITQLVRDVKLELRIMEFKYMFSGDTNPTTSTASTSKKKERTSTSDNSRQQQQQQQQQRRRDDTNTIMNEYELTNINQKWRNQFTVSSDRARSDYESYMRNRRDYDEIANDDDDDDDDDDGMSVHNNNNNKLLNKFQLNRMVQRSNQLQSSILLDQIRLQRLERRIVCYENDGDEGIFERIVGNTLYAMNEFPSLGSFASAYYYSNDNSPNSNNSNDTGNTIMNPITIIKQRIKKFSLTFNESMLVLLRKLDRVSSVSSTTTTTTSAAASTTTIQGEGVNIINNSRNYTSLTDYIIQETSAGIRIIGNLLSNPGQLTHLVDPETPTLVAHVPAILTRLDRLETHVTPILNRVLNNKQHLRSIEPYLSVILERLDDIEPHLPWILDHIDTLAPYTGLLLKHIDELLLYAKVDKYEEQSVVVLAVAGGGNSTNDDSGSIRGGNYAFADQLLPYLEVYVSQLDLVG